MATSSDSTNYEHASMNGDGIYLSDSSEAWSMNGVTPTASVDSSAVATDASSVIILANNLKALLAAKGIIHS